MIVCVCYSSNNSFAQLGAIFFSNNNSQMPSDNAKLEPAAS